MKSLLIPSCMFWTVICQDYSFSYDEQEKWPGICTFGSRQSPIALTSGINTNIILPAMSCLSYNTPIKVRVINTGEGIKIMVANGTFSPTVWAGGLPGFYSFHSMHFHWSAEHTVNGERPPLELHILHYRTMYKSFKEARRHADGIAVFAIHFEISSKPRDIDHFVEAIQALKGKTNQEIILDNFIVDDFAPANASFYIYNGSMTRPPCLENIRWTVFKPRVPISHKQLQLLRGLKDEEGNPFPAYVRKLQPVNNREIQEGFFDLSTQVT